MKVAVTGATGFVGIHVLRELARRNDIAVVGASRHPPADGTLPGDACHVVLDLARPSPDDFGRLGEPDVLIHLAWAGLPNYRSLHHFESELPRQYAFLRALVDSGLRRLLVAGTCFEYGMRSGELREDMATDPHNPYGYAKDALRRQLEFLCQANPCRLTWARLFYMYGEGQPSTSLYPQLLSAGARGDPGFKMSRGDQLRDFLPVQQVASAIVALALQPGASGIVNVCSGQPVSVRALAEGWIRERGWQMDLELGHYPYPDYEPMAFWGSNERLAALIGAGSKGSS